MRIYLITGTSKGLGKALVNELLNMPDSLVYGHSREQSIFHENYFHQVIDLSNPQSLQTFQFPEIINADSITLINNAATVQPIGFLGTLDSNELSQSLHLNFLTPIVLSNQFMKLYALFQGRKQIVNIGTGASTNPYAGWSAYCATKAGLEMFTKVGNLEQNSKINGFEFYQIAPGVLDTNMQEQIRNIDESRFPLKSKFVSLHDNHQLKSPNLAAQLLLSYLSSDYNTVECIHRLNL